MTSIDRHQRHKVVFQDIQEGYAGEGGLFLGGG